MPLACFTLLDGFGVVERYLESHRCQNLLKTALPSVGTGSSLAIYSGIQPVLGVKTVHGIPDMMTLWEHWPNSQQKRLQTVKGCAITAFQWSGPPFTCLFLSHCSDGPPISRSKGFNSSTTSRNKGCHRPWDFHLEISGGGVGCG